MTHVVEPRLQVFSDLHLELYPTRDLAAAALEHWIHPVEGATACILAGDIATPTGKRRSRLELALDFFTARYERVFYVPGNHEFYRSTAAAAQEKLRKAVAKHPRVTLLEPGIHGHWAGRRVIGATLWFRPGRHNARYAHLVADFAEIREFVPWVYEQNRAHLAWLNETVAQGDIVVTHHLPSRRSIASRYLHEASNLYFVCDVERLIEERRPALWVHGHTHESFRYQLGSTTILCNPLGYSGDENPAFDAGAWVAA